MTQGGCVSVYIHHITQSHRGEVRGGFFAGANLHSWELHQLMPQQGVTSPIDGDCSRFCHVCCPWRISSLSLKAFCFFDTLSFLITVLFPHLLGERREERKKYLGKTVAWQTQAFFPQPNPCL